MSFQSKINVNLPRGVAGDFASINPRNSMLAGEGALVAGEDIIVGQFAFADLSTGKAWKSFSAGRRVGFVHRNYQAIVSAPNSASMIIPKGRETTLFPDGDFYAIAPATVAVGDKVYAEDATGALVNAPTSAQDTGFMFAEPAQTGELVKITKNSI